MRETFHGELDHVRQSLVEMTNLVRSAMARATTALLDADLQLAESVIAADDEIDRLYREIEERCFELLARQQPVARDLRTIVASLRMVADLERMGDLALHIAKIARMRYPASAVPPEIRSTVLELGQAAERIVAKAGSVVADLDIAKAVELEADDDAIDALQRKMFAILLDDHWKYGVEPAVDLALVGRFYERYADHAVTVAQRVIYLATGEFPDQPLVS